MEQFKCERREFWPDLMDASHGIVSSAPPDPSSSSSDSGLKICTDCRTTKTPLWRAGPCGPKSLCNACGIRYRKSRRTVPASKDVGAKVRKEKREMEGGAERFGLSFKLQMLGKGLWKPRSMVQKQRRRRRRRSVLREEEQAAVLLMALSSGVVYA